MANKRLHFVSPGQFGTIDPLMTPKKAQAKLKKTQASGSAVSGNRKKRSAEIIGALRTCLLQKGYADTSITDVANEAGLSVSHLLYYYSGKDEILLELSRELHQRVLDSIAIHVNEQPEERIHLLVHNMFVGVSRDELALLREIIGLAPHKPALQDDVENYAKTVSQHFERLFEQSPRQPGVSAADSATLAGALWIGLMIQAAFQTQLDENVVRRLFRKALLMLANLENN